MSTFLTVLLLVSSISCGKKNTNSARNVITSEEPNDSTDGDYRAVLKTLNTSLKGNVAFGTAIMKISDNKFSVKLNLAHVPEGTKHIQSVHTNGKCPNLVSDANADSFIDIVEGMTSFGKVLIPLDSDLSAQLLGNDYYPKGIYSYSEEADLSLLVADLSAPDEDPNDNLVKLKPGEALNFGRRTLVISSISENNDLPSSVRTIGDFPSEASIPIACGEIVRIENEE